MTDSTNPRVMADNIKELSGLSGVLQSEISEIQGEFIEIVEIRHDYTVAANGLVSWNPKNDSGFSKEGYTPLGIIGFTNSSTSAYLVNMAAIDNSYGFYLKNMADESVTAYVKYYVLYVKSYE